MTWFAVVVHEHDRRGQVVVVVDDVLEVDGAGFAFILGDAEGVPTVVARVDCVAPAAGLSAERSRVECDQRDLLRQFIDEPVRSLKFESSDDNDAVNGCLCRVNHVVDGPLRGCSVLLVGWEEVRYRRTFLSAD